MQNNLLTNSDWLQNVKRVANGIRRRALLHSLKTNGGYISQACSSAEILAVLYAHVMHLGPSQAPMTPLPFSGVPGKNNPNYITGSLYNGPRSPEYDRFIFSPAHYALALYSALIEVGRMSPEGLDTYNQDGSTVEMIAGEHSPGMESSTGSLSQALSQAGGIALARKLRHEGGRVWVFMSDGEFEEGQTWEALAALAHFKLDNIGVYVDVNGQQVEGRIEDQMGIEPLKSRVEAFGANVHVVPGHDIEALIEPTKFLIPGQPLVVLAYTDPCKGIEPLRDRYPLIHYIRFKSPEEKDRYQVALDSLIQEMQEK